MVKCFSVVSNQINMLNEQQIKSNALLERINSEAAKSSERLRNIESLTEITNKRLRSIDYNMAVRAKAEQSTAKMMEQISNNADIQAQNSSAMRMYAEQADRR